MRVTVTGASGFLGAWAVRALAASGHDTTAVVRERAPWRLQGVDGVTVAHGDPDSWPELAAGARPEAVLLLDWAGVGARSRYDEELQQSNLVRWEAVVNAVLASGATRLIGLGSQAEFGPQRDIIADDAPEAPVTPYGRAKVEAADLLERLSQEAGALSVWARVFSVYGPLDNEGVLLAQVSDASVAGRAVPLTSARHAWSYLYAADAAMALALLAEHSDPPDRCNVAHPDAPALRHIVDAFADNLVGTQLEYGALPDAAGGAQLRARTTRLSALGWEPKTSLFEGLARTADWLLGGVVDDPFGAAALPRRPAREQNSL